ncbi:Lipopolysaccharide biosynthesis protein WzxC [Pseudomonas oleovorans subsp. oleovorans]|uniref:Transporter n=1 Tax=Ectopseudomonas oleovorans TaxID=301 RepID=A0A379PLW7_ECTOL|nr:oligosaccharide flippase family protein [Pseudomonas oleovorans]OWK40074.1 Lipopolysaccharide biosynthesis protein WzxC [Pseudomonas oleovorans subsp. oleovorans]SEJ88222.1 polysaccharide transporter, PST family [Pseudomonas oleovorans]SUD51462.1 transporter [Pseudomonas oleovorans]SUE72814.1 transporter [Pseudomonas oleovorans]
MPMHSLVSRLFSPSGPFWVFVQHGAGRIAVALKFLVLARVLGPEGVGLIGVGLLAMAVAEALSELGLMQALVQRREALTQAQLSAVWGWQLLRAVLLGIGLALLAWPAAQLFSIPEAFPIFALVGVLLLLRGSVNLSLTLALRDMQMRRIGLFNASFVLIDAVLGILVAWLTQSVLAVFVAMAVAEGMRWLASYRVFAPPPRPSLSREVSEFASFGKWIWMNSILNFLLNQTDKFMVAKTIGVSGLGTYQMAQRFAQLGVADIGIMLSQYLFPKLSQQMRSDHQRAVELTLALLALMAAGGMAAVLTLNALAEPLFVVLLGESWRAAAPAFGVLVGGMYGGLLTAVLVPFVKAEGKAWIVTGAALLQLVALLALLYLLRGKGITGVALASSVAIWVAMLLILAGTLLYVETVWQILREQWALWLLLAGCLLLTLWVPALWWLCSGVALGLFAARFSKLLRQLK